MKTIISGCVLVLMYMHAIHGQQDTSWEQQMAAYAGWMDHLYEFGVQMEGDTCIVTEEARLAALDPAWRRVLYPDSYSWQQVSALLEARDLKKALWYIINLWYDNQNRPLAGTLLTSLQQSIHLPKALAASFYTFIFFDPEIGHFADNKPVIDHPDVMEGKLNAIREMMKGQGMR